MVRCILKFIMKKARFIVLLLFLIILSKFSYGALGGSFTIGLQIFHDWDNDGVGDIDDPDDDNDGINDTEDYLLGNSSSINTTIPDIDVKVNDSTNISRIFNDSLFVNITNTTHGLVEFEWNFSLSTLNLYNMTIEKQNSTSSVGYILVNRLDLQGNTKKNITIDDVHPNINSVCVKDSEVSSIDEITSSCSGIGEISVNCPGSNNGYRCIRIDGNTRYKITGLAYSAAIEQEEAAEETPPTGGEGGEGGGGGGGAAAVPARVYAFDVSKGLIKVLLKPGKSARESLKISNTGDVSLSINIDTEGLEGVIVEVSEHSFDLEPGESKTVEFTFHVEVGQELGIYPGKIIVTGDSIEEEVKVIVEVESEKPLFDVDVEILPRYKTVFQGEDVTAQIILYNLRGIGRVDVSLLYLIKDMEGNLIAEESETVAVETQTSLVKSLKLPEDVEPGSYVFYVSVRYNGFIGSSSDLFDVIKIQPLLGPKIFTPLNVVLGVIALILIGFIMFISSALLDLVRSYRRETTKPEEIEEVKPKEEVELLKEKYKDEVELLKLKQKDEEEILREREKEVKEVEDLIAKAREFIKRVDIEMAKKTYVLIMELYKNLHKEEKEKVHNKIIDLHHEIVEHASLHHKKKRGKKKKLINK